MTDSQTDLTIEVKLGFWDVWWATIQIFQSLKILWVVLPLVIVGLIVQAPAGTGSGTTVGLVAGPVLLFGLLPLLQAFLATRKPILRNPIFHTFSQTGVSSKFQGGLVAIDWPLIQKAWEDSRYIAIRGKQGGPLLIPKRQVTEGDLESLRSLLRGHLQDRAKSI